MDVIRAIKRAAGLLFAVEVIDEREQQRRYGERNEHPVFRPASEGLRQPQRRLEQPGFRELVADAKEDAQRGEYRGG